jgi:outer membrane scaffolding protein for murein synthesis (MipA/OmpV family)
MAPLAGASRMCGKFMRVAIYSALILVCASVPRMTAAQTPSPLQEWQYSTGMVLQRLFEPNLPEWRIVVGAGEEVRPLYDGSRPYRGEAGPVFNIRYYDYAFASTGEGLGVNFLMGDNYRAGIAMAYDLGRRVSDYESHLHGLGDIDPAPVVKLFGSYVISKKFPLVLRADIRQFVGGGDGALGDVSAYMPLPGSSKKLMMFAGPSVTFADHLYLQREFGVNATQALASGYPQYESHPGIEAVGLGFSATRFITDHWLVNVDAAVNHLHGSAAQSPVTERTGQRVLAVSIAYSR